MSDQTQLTITVAITTRARMNPSTPRFKQDWTYHHVLPVRLYFMAAWMILHVCKHSDAWATTRIVGKDALEAMCQNGHNRLAITNFLATRDDAPTAVELAELAKLCASPPCGGFAGPNPNQRTDDPHDGVERFPPVSADAAWWACITSIGMVLKDAFGLLAMPAPNTNVSAQRTVAEWCADVETIAKLIAVADAAPRAEFDGSGWSITGGHPWAKVTGRPVAAGDPNIGMALRRRTAPVTFLPPTATPHQLHNAWQLVKLEDQLKLPPPPL